MRNHVCFYSPQHFNRGSGGSNPFFAPLLAVCKKNGIPCRLLEEPDGRTDKPRNPVACRADWILYFVIACRKLLPLRLWNSFGRRELFIGRLLNCFTFGRLRASRYFTISNSMVEMLPGLNPEANVYDLQHGIIYSTHSGYFLPDEQLREDLRNPQIHFLVYGEGYRDCFFKHPANRELLQDRVHVIGDVLSAGAQPCPADSHGITRQTIVISLQFTRDWTPEQLVNLRRLLESFLQEIMTTPLANRYRVLLKHHPRFNNAVDLSDIPARYPFAEFTSKSLQALVPECCWHVTLHSTTAFEFAAFGIPTCFWLTPDFPSVESIFMHEYQYPCQPPTITEALRMHEEEPERYAETCRKAQEWHRRFYAPFDESVALKILTS